MTTERRLEAARRCARAGSYQEAARHFEAHIETLPPGEGLQERIEHGFSLLLAGDGAGARRIWETLREVVARAGRLPERVATLWRRFTTLVGGASRKLVLTGVTAAVVATMGCSGCSSHRYSGGVNLPVATVDAVQTESGQTSEGPNPTATGAAEAAATTDAAGVPALGGPATPPEPTVIPFKPPVGFSAHRYSGGVALDLKLDGLKPKTTPSPPGPGYSAHRYSGGVRLDLKRKLEGKDGRSGK